ncbi:hypothetical protein ACN1C3_32780 [Pseudomonas sp. H11T01]|uniref:hypothetical protein n=1 Tax=Pseudomonas sp. H11T01 TaxID=3402749 RepID=UPI003AC24393
MLYPIELLRQMATAKKCAVQGTACMLTAKPAFVMSSVGFLSVGQSEHKTAASPIVQIASLQNAIIAKCNGSPIQKQPNSLFLNN